MEGSYCWVTVDVGVSDMLGVESLGMLSLEGCIGGTWANGSLLVDGRTFRCVSGVVVENGVCGIVGVVLVGDMVARMRPMRFNPKIPPLPAVVDGTDSLGVGVCSVACTFVNGIVVATAATAVVVALGVVVVMMVLVVVVDSHASQRSSAAGALASSMVARAPVSFCLVDDDDDDVVGGLSFG